MIQTPAIKKLIGWKMSILAIPCGGTFVNGIHFLMNKDAIIAAAREATKWVEAAINAVREAKEPNTWKDKSDDEIAVMLLAEIEKKRKR